jgi:hypothetical protein
MLIYWLIWNDVLYKISIGNVYLGKAPNLFFDKKLVVLSGKIIMKLGGGDQIL